MPSNWSNVDNSFPTFTGRESAREQVIIITNYMYLLVEQLKYNLENLDTTNWNKQKLEKFQNDTTKDVEEEVKKISEDLSSAIKDLMVLTQETANLVKRVNELEDLSDRMTEAEKDIGLLEKEQQDIKQSLSDLEEAMGVAQADIDELFSVFQRTENGATIGKAGEDLHLVGNVYINGVLIQ